MKNLLSLEISGDSVGIQEVNFITKQLLKLKHLKINFSPGKSLGHLALGFGAELESLSLFANNISGAKSEWFGGKMMKSIKIGLLTDGFYKIFGHQKHLEVLSVEARASFVELCQDVDWVTCFPKLRRLELLSSDSAVENAASKQFFQEISSLVTLEDLSLSNFFFAPGTLTLLARFEQEKNIFGWVLKFFWRQETDSTKKIDFDVSFGRWTLGNRPSVGIFEGTAAYAASQD